MPVWTDVPEIGILARIAERGRFGFILRGSTAQRLVDADRNEETVASLFAAVPPFSDIDFLVENPRDRRLLAHQLTTQLPESRFFRVEIRTLDELERYEQSSLAIEGQPWVRFGAGESFNDSVVIRDTGEGNVDVRMKAMEPCPILHVRSEFLHSPDVITDFAYCYRRCPTYEGETKGLHEYLEKMDPRVLVRAVRGPHERKLLFALVKLLLARVAGETLDPVDVAPALWHELSLSHHNPMIRKAAALLGAHHDPAHTALFGVVATSTPRRRSARSPWLDQLEGIEEFRRVNEGETVTLHERELHSTETAQFPILMRLPPVEVTTDEPERPGCCHYRDFSRGTIEVGWAGPTGPDDGAWTLVKSDEEDFFLAPSVASQYRQQYSRKIDYGFTCQLAGEAKRVYVVYAGAADV